jgi:hypothetical protein
MLSMVIAFTLLWISNIRDTLRLSLCFLPVSFLVFRIVVRVAPYFVVPTLFSGEIPGPLTTLALDRPPAAEQTGHTNEYPSQKSAR